MYRRRRSYNRTPRLVAGLIALMWTLVSRTLFTQADRHARSTREQMAPRMYTYLTVGNQCTTAEYRARVPYWLLRLTGYRTGYRALQVGYVCCGVPGEYVLHGNRDMHDAGRGYPRQAHGMVQLGVLWHGTDHG